MTNYNNNAPTEIIFVLEGVLEVGHVTPQTYAVDVNNSDAPFYSSEGRFILSVDGLLCVYHPDANDEQSPDQTEMLTDGKTISADATGPTAAEVDSNIIVDIGNCH